MLQFKLICKYIFKEPPQNRPCFNNFPIEHKSLNNALVIAFNECF
jgi:hypothetical protein